MTAISGTSFLAKLFAIRNTGGSALHSDLLDLVNGTIPIIYVSNALESSQCRELVRQFKCNAGKRPRSDGVPGYVLGAYHYGKTYQEYTSQIDSSERYVNEFLQAGGDPVSTVIGWLQTALQSQKVTIRAATWHSRRVATARALSWTASGRFLLEPHEDIGQLSDPRQSGFEPQKTFGKTVIAVNLYLNVPLGGGALRIWNICPDDNARIAFDTQHKGYPYPVEALAEVSSLDLTPATGSVVLMNGGLIHAVTGYDKAIGQDDPRLIVNFFMGCLDEKTIVHWV
jgi:hypothetical protein